MVETMIERIARLLCERDRDDPEALCHGQEGAIGTTWANWQAYTTDAKAILAVMRDPTERMLLSIPRDWRRGSAEDLWQAMVDAGRAGR